MIDLMKKGFNFGLGLAFVSKDQVQKMVDELVKKGEVNKEESKTMIQQLMQRGEAEQNGLKQMISEQIQQRAADMNLPTQGDITRLEQRIEILEKRLMNLQGEGFTSNPATGTAEVPLSDIRE